MNTINIERIIAQSRELKSLPDSVYQLNQLMHNKNVTMSEIADIVASDPVLSAKILKSVNSPFYGFPSKIETIAYAVSILGIDSIRYLAISNAVISKFSGSANTLVPIDSFWRHSFATAIIAQQLARMRNHGNDERIFTAGLLHDLGSLLMAIAIPHDYKQVISKANSEQIPLHQAESEFLGFTHIDITAELLKSWNLPNSIVEGIRNMYDCDINLDYQVDCALLNIADSVASSTFPGIRLANMDLSIQRKVWNVAGIQPHQLNDILDELDNMVENAMKGMYFESAA
jgi:HD-like signal output (HDOD) protein